MAQTVIRGNLAKITVTFLGPDGATVTPDKATLYVVYTSLSLFQKDVLALTTTDSGVTWVASWDTTKADPQTLSWHARCAGTTPCAVEDQITVVANPANPSILGIIAPQPVPPTA